MKKRVPDKFWFPWWPDKWIFGSVRIECTPAERGIWVDLLSLASKDDGHIRANEGTPYPLQQLAGMLILPEDDLKDAIDKFIKSKKLTKNKNGTLYITKWDKYQFSERHKRRIESEMSEKTDTMADDKDAILYDSINDNKLDNNTNDEFEQFWKGYRIMGNPKDEVGNKQEAKKAYKTLRKKISKEEILKAFHGEADYLKYERLNNNFNKKKKHATTWLRSDRWKEHADFIYKPPL